MTVNLPMNKNKAPEPKPLNTSNAAKQPKRNKTPSEVGRAYAAARWGGYGSREAWREAMSKQCMQLPKVVT